MSEGLNPFAAPSTMGTISAQAPRLLARLVMVSIALKVVGDVVVGVLGYALQSRLPDIFQAEQIDIDALSASSALLLTGYWLTMLVKALCYVCAGVSWFFWQSRVRACLSDEGMSHGSLAWLWWLVPFANLLIPRRVMKELLLRVVDTEPDWFAVWWGAWLVYLTAGYAETKLTWIAGPLGLLTAAASVVAGVLAVRLVHTLTQALEARLQRSE